MFNWTMTDQPFPAGDANAVRDVFTEREKQIRLGYTPEHDMQHTPGQILEFGLPSAHRTREELVRLAACALAAIARYDMDHAESDTESIDTEED